MSADPASTTVEKSVVYVSPQGDDTRTLGEEEEEKEDHDIASVNLPHENTKIEWECETWLDGQ